MPNPVSFDDLIPNSGNTPTQAPQAAAPQADPAPAPAKGGLSFDDLVPANGAPAATSADGPKATTGSGFTDNQKQQILAYLPHAKDAADLHRFALQLSGGKDDIGNADDVLANYHKGHKEFAWQEPTPRPEPKFRPEGVSRTEATITGALESIPGADRIGAAVDATLKTPVQDAAHALGLGNDAPGWAANYASNLHDNQALSDQAANEHPGYYYGGMVAGTLPQLFIPGEGEASLAGTMGRAAVQAGGYSLAGTHQDLSTGEGWKNAGETAAIDAGLGAATGGILHGVAGMAPRSAGEDVLNAADRLNDSTGANISLQPAHTGGPVTQAVTYLANKTIGGGLAIGARNKGLENQVTNAADAVAGRLDPSAPSLLDAATTLKNGRGDTSLATLPQRLDQRTSKLYDAVDTAAGATGAKISYKSPQTVNFLDSQIARLQGAGDQAGVDMLQAERDFFNQPHSLQEIKDHRSIVLGKSFEKTNTGIANGALKQAWQLSGDDLQKGLQSVGLNDAVGALKRADTAYSMAKAHKDVISNLLEDSSPEQMVNTINGYVRSDPSALQNVMRLASPAEAQTLKAAVINKLLKNGNGELDFKAFGNNWSDKNFSPRAKALIFNGQTRNDLNDLATVMQAAQKTGAGRPTSAITQGLRGADVMGNVAHFLVRGVPGVSTADHALNAAGVLLSVPGVARALVTLGRGGRAVAVPVAKRLEMVARRTPDQAAQILGLRDAIMGLGEPAEPSADQSQGR